MQFSLRVILVYCQVLERACIARSIVSQNSISISQNCRKICFSLSFFLFLFFFFLTFASRLQEITREIAREITHCLLATSIIAFPSLTSTRRSRSTRRFLFPSFLFTSWYLLDCTTRLRPRRCKSRRPSRKNHAENKTWLSRLPG